MPETAEDVVLEVCPDCGATFEVDIYENENTCPVCGQTYFTEKAMS